MKKLLAAIAVASLALTACGSSQTDPNDDDTFTVGMECNYAPFNWQTKDKTSTSVSLGDGAGYCDGYDVMISKKIAKKIGQKVEVKKISWDGLQPALDSGEIDAIIAGMTANKKREKGIDFTTPYYSSETVMIVRSDSEMAGYNDIQQFSGHKVMGQKNTNYDTIIDQIKGVSHETPKATYPELVVALQNGDTDGITAELPVANGIVSANQGLSIIHFADGKGFDNDSSVSIGLKDGTRKTKFFKRVQKALDSISEEQRQQMMQDAVDHSPAED